MKIKFFLIPENLIFYICLIFVKKSFNSNLHKKVNIFYWKLIFILHIILYVYLKYID